MGTIRHYHHHYHFSYVTSFRRHFSTVVVVIAVLILLLLILLKFLTPQRTIDLNQISAFSLVIATINTLVRLIIAYALALVLSIPLALFITSNPKTEKVLLPIVDILQSIPVLAFFPIIVLAFIRANFLDGAAIFIIAVTMIGNLVFSIIGGLKTVPSDIENAAYVFGAKGLRKLTAVTLPAIFPYIMTGSLLAWSQAWSIIIVAEALHTYIPHGTTQNDLIGLGSLLVDAFASGKNAIFLTSLSVMIVIISLLNYFVWQKLLHATERFRFD